MMNYFENKDKAKTMAILDPKSSSKFPVKQKIVGEISTGSNLAGKLMKGLNYHGQITCQVLMLLDL